MDKCPHCGCFNNDPDHKHVWVFANLKCYRRQIANVETQFAHQTELLRQAMEVVRMASKMSNSGAEPVWVDANLVRDKAQALLSDLEAVVLVAHATGEENKIQLRT